MDASMPGPTVSPRRLPQPWRKLFGIRGHGQMAALMSPAFLRNAWSMQVIGWEVLRVAADSTRSADFRWFVHSWSLSGRDRRPALVLPISKWQDGVDDLVRSRQSDGCVHGSCGCALAGIVGVETGSRSVRQRQEHFPGRNGTDASQPQAGGGAA